MFNEPGYIQEFSQLCRNLCVDSAFEIGYGSGELVEALRAIGIDVEGIDKSTELSGGRQAPYLHNVAWEDFVPTKKYDLVYSSGVIEHFSFKEMDAFLKKAAKWSGKYVLTIAPNENCEAYMNCKAKVNAPWKDELAFTTGSLSNIHDLAGLKVVSWGMIAAEWAKRFGPEPSEPYLVYCLAEKKAEEVPEVKEEPAKPEKRVRKNRRKDAADTPHQG